MKTQIITLSLVAFAAAAHAADTTPLSPRDTTLSLPKAADPVLYKSATRLLTSGIAQVGLGLPCLLFAKTRRRGAGLQHVRGLGHEQGPDALDGGRRTARADPKAGWCNQCIATGSTWRSKEHWQMLFTAHGGNGGNVGLAESDDLVKWTMIGPVRVEYRNHPFPDDPDWQRDGLKPGETIPTASRRIPTFCPNYRRLALHDRQLHRCGWTGSTNVAASV